MGYNVGALLPLNFQLPDVTMTDKFVRAYLRKADGSAVSGSPVSLTEVANAYYSASFAMPDEPSIVAQYISYDDSGHTVVTDGVSPGVDRFEKNPSSSDVTVTYVTQITGLVTDADATQMAEIVTGEDKTVLVQLRNSDGTPYDLSAVSAISFKMRNADGSLLVKTLPSGAIAIVGDAVLGKFSVSLTAAETALLDVDNSAAIEVDLTQSSLLTIIEITKAVNVIESLS